MRRALLLLALLAPALARAQAITAGSINFAPAAIGSSLCNSSANNNLTLSFNLQLIANASINGGDYTVLATTSATTTSTNGLTVCPSGAGTVTTVAASSSVAQVISVGAASLVSAAGLQCSNTSNPTINVCIHYVPSGSSAVTGSAVGTISLSTQPPSAPYIWLVEPADGALLVHWNPGGGTAPSYYQIVATAGGVSRYSGNIFSADQNVNGRITGLTNGTTYAVTVIAYSSGGDAGPASNEVPATPQPTAGFFDRYQAAGGKEQGGCASGPAGLGALLLSAAGLAGLRRRS
jgi:hypothetical protein